MARTGITFDDVQRAIDTLLQRQEAPSVQKVRDILGTGSFTTISDHLREWRTQREQRRDVPPPQGMPVELQGLAEELWGQAQALATENLGHYREEANRRVEAAQEAVAEANRRAEDAEQRESALAAHMATTDKRLQECVAEFTRLESTTQGLEQQVEKERQRAAQLDDQLGRLQQENERQGKEYQEAVASCQAEHRERLRQEEQRHESAESRLMALLDGARQERQAAEKAHAQRLKQAEHRNDLIQQQLHTARSDLGEEEKRHRETQLAKSRADENVRAKANEVAMLNERIEEQRRQASMQAERLSALEAKLDERLWTLTRAQEVEHKTEQEQKSRKQRVKEDAQASRDAAREPGSDPRGE